MKWSYRFLRSLILIVVYFLPSEGWKVWYGSKIDQEIRSKFEIWLEVKIIQHKVQNIAPKMTSCAKLTAKNPKNHKSIAIVKDVQNCPQYSNTKLLSRNSMKSTFPLPAEPDQEVNPPCFFVYGCWVLWVFSTVFFQN